MKGHRACFDETKTKRGQRFKCNPVFIKPRRETDREIDEPKWRPAQRGTKQKRGRHQHKSGLGREEDPRGRLRGLGYACFLDR